MNLHNLACEIYDDLAAVIQYDELDTGESVFKSADVNVTKENMFQHETFRVLFQFYSFIESFVTRFFHVI